MYERLRLLALLLAVPTIGYGVATALQSSYSSELRDAARRQHAGGPPELIAKLTAADICARATGIDDIGEACDSNDQMSQLRAGSIATAVAGVALVALIGFAGLAAARDRRLLLRLFRPGIRVTAIVIVVLIAAHAAIAIALLLHVHRVGAGLVLLGAFAGIVAVTQNTFSMVKKIETPALGKELTPTEAPLLWSTVTETARKLGSLQPDHIVIGLDPVFFVTEANVKTPDEMLVGKTMFCSLPLARILTRDEFTAIVGHELGHFRGEDTKYSEEFYPIYRGTAASIVSLHRAGGGRGFGMMALGPALAILDVFLERFAVAERRHSRERELVADQAAVSVTSTAVMASALLKVHAFSRLWSDVQEITCDLLKEGRRFENASETYAAAVREFARPSSFDGIDDAHSSHPTDTHPALSVRLDALGTTIGATTPTALVVAPIESAGAVVADLELRERELTEQYQLLIAKHLNVDPSTVKQFEARRVRRCASCGEMVLPRPDATCPNCGATLG